MHSVSVKQNPSLRNAVFHLCSLMFSTSSVPFEMFHAVSKAPPRTINFIYHVLASSSGQLVMQS